MSTNFRKKPRFFKDDQKRTRVIPGTYANQADPQFINQSHSDACTIHEQRLAQRLNQLPKQEVQKAPNGVNVIVPKRTAQLKLIEAHTDNVIITPREGESQEQLDKRSQHFIDIYIHGGVIPPPMLHKLPDGRTEVIDGRARANAYRILGVKTYPANENDELSDIAAGANESGVFESGNKFIEDVGGFGQKVGGFAGHQIGSVIGSQVGRKRGSFKLRRLSKQEKAAIHAKNAIDLEHKYPLIKPLHTRTRIAKWKTAGYRHATEKLNEETAKIEARIARKKKSKDDEMEKAKSYASKAQKAAASANVRRDSARANRRKQ